MDFATELAAILASVAAGGYLLCRLWRVLRGKTGCTCVEGKLAGADDCLDREASEQGHRPSTGACAVCPLASDCGSAQGAKDAEEEKGAKG